MRVFTEIQRFDQLWFKVLILVVFLITFGSIGLGYAKIPQKETTAYLVAAVPAGCIVLVITGAIFFVKLETKIDNEGIQYGFWPFQKKLRVASWRDIETADIRKYKPLTEFGGWGYKFSLSGKGKVYNTKGNMGIQIVFKDNSKTLVGTQKPEEAQKVIAMYTSKNTPYEN
jgi:hypothetical protein